MKKVLFLNGSPRKNGNTSALIKLISQKLDNKVFETNAINLYNAEIKPCNDCRGCKKGKLECVLTDGMTKIYKKLDESDIIIFGTPIYWYGPTATMKLLMDRFRPYYVNKKLKGKNAIMLFSAGTSEEDCDLSFKMFGRMLDALEINNITTISAKAHDEGEVYDDDNAMYKVDKLSELLNSLN